MPDPVIELAERGRALSSLDRERLVELLLASLAEPPSPEVEAAWDKEIERRMAAHARGETKSHALEDVLQEARGIAP
jgi:putative addiction module component (TIGR02574 family)